DPHKKEISPYIRQKLTFLGQLISSTIAMKLMEQSSYREATFQVLLARLSEAMASYDTYTEGLRNSIDTLLRLANAGGIGWKLEDTIETFGDSPPEDTVARISRYCWKVVDKENLTVYNTNAL